MRLLSITCTDVDILHSFLPRCPGFGAAAPRGGSTVSSLNSDIAPPTRPFVSTATCNTSDITKPSLSLPPNYKPSGFADRHANNSGENASFWDKVRTLCLAWCTSICATPSRASAGRVYSPAFSTSLRGCVYRQSSAAGQVSWHCLAEASSRPWFSNALSMPNYSVDMPIQLKFKSCTGL